MGNLEQEISTTRDPASVVPAGTQTGKTTRTQALSPARPSTKATEGSPVDNRYTELAFNLSGDETPIGALLPQACEGDAPSADCRLTEAKRRDTVTELGHRVSTIASRWHAALLEARMDALAEDENVWGFFLEMAFRLGSFGAGAAVMKALTWLSNANIGTAALNAVDSILASPERIKGAIATLSQGTRTWAKNKAHYGPNRTKANIIDELGDLPGQWAAEVRNTAPLHLKDDELVALCVAFDPVHYPMARFRLEIADLVARYTAQVGAVGEKNQRAATISGMNGAGKCQLREALVQHVRVGGAGGRSFIQRGTALGGVNNESNSYYFVRWLDADLVAAAEAKDRAVVGEETLYLSVETAGDHCLANPEHAEVQTWVQQLAAQKEIT
jgi:hypothetical protein